MPFRHRHTIFFEDPRLSESLRRCAKVSQRKNIPKKETLPQNGLSFRISKTKPILFLIKGARILLSGL